MKVRIGIDVGGTFTHAVAVDNATLELVESAVTPTTHTAQEGVAKGVVIVFEKILQTLSQKNILPEEIIFVAHSTTQATNALLEGDLSSVGIIALGRGIEGIKAKADADISKIEVASGKYINTSFSFIDTSGNWNAEVEKTVEQLKNTSTGCIVAAEAFSVDDPSKEIYVKESAANAGLPACGTHEMSGLYGLRVRTKTAVINAAILPKMVETANMTEKSLTDTGVTSPLMVMRSDGGVMAVEQMRRRPLLTLLSGPAAGIAAALAYIRATDAVFLEVGGTSTDMAVIKNGRSTIRSAVIGGHMTYMKTLDSRTLGVGGGSMVRISGGRITGTGPRSAHIAGLKYVSFADPSSFDGKLKFLSVIPKPSDPEYLTVENEKGERYAITLTCAANYLGYVKEGDYAKGNSDSVGIVFEALGAWLGQSPSDAAQMIMNSAAEQINAELKKMISDYSLAEIKIKLIGGGGGSCAIVPYVAKKKNYSYEIAKKAEVISAIGAAMAMLRDTVEKNIFSPSPSDIEQIRREASDSVIAMGADPQSIEVQVEVDSQKNIVRATATGSIEFKAQDLTAQPMDDEERKEQILSYFGMDSSVDLLASTDALYLYAVEKKSVRFFGLLKSKKKIIAVSDPRGSIKLQVPDGTFYLTSSASFLKDLQHILEKHREYGDAGALTKGVWMIYGHRIVDYTAIGDEDRILSLVSKELDICRDDEKVAYIAL